MRNILLVFFLFISFALSAQTFVGTGGPIKNDSTITSFNLNVTGLGNMTTTFGLVRVTLNLTHPAVQELHIYLRSPQASIALSVGNGFGADYTNTIFENTATTSIRDATAPFTGSFRPENSLAVFNTNGLNANGSWTLMILDDQKNWNSGSVQSFSLQFGTNPAQPTPFTKSNLPVLVVNTYGKGIPAITDISGKIFILDKPGGNNNLSDTQTTKSMPIGIHMRGNSSTGGLKDPYSFSPKDIHGVDSDIVVCGMPIENDWILNNAYSDQSFMKDPISYYLSNRMGQYASRTKYCELILNDDYRGIYILMEKIKQDKNRVDISKLKLTDTSGTDVTGGYIIKKDGAPGPKDSGFMNTASGFYYLYHDPDSPAIQQKKYIKAFIDTAVNSVINIPLFDTMLGYRHYVDYKSVIDYIIICELGVSGDTYQRSTYWHKNKITKGNKLYFGPVWDFNYGWTNALTAFKFPTFTPWKKMYDDTFFKRELWCRYNEVRKNFLNPKTMNYVMDSLVSTLYDAMYRNDERWIQNKSGGQVISNCYYKDACYFLKKYSYERLTFMDSVLRSSCSNIRSACKPFLDYEVLNACTGDSATVLVNTTSLNVTMSPITGVRKVNNHKFLVGPPGGGNYKLIWTDCNSSDSVLISIANSTKPILNCTGKDSILLGDTVLLVVTGAANYIWSPAVLSSNAAGDSVYVNPNTTTNYTITGNVGLGCTSTITKKINVKPAHELIFYNSADSLCSGSMLKLKASGAERYIWDVNNLLTIADSLTLYPTVDLVVKLTGLIGGNMSDMKMKIIKVFPVTQLKVIPLTPVYYGTTPVMITVKGGVTYNWTPTNGLDRYDNNIVYASPSSSTLYTIRAIDSNNCNAITTVYVSSKVGISKSVSINSIKVYPNPASDNITVENESGKDIEMEIYNSIGKKVLQSHVPIGKSMIDLRDWAAGIYSIKTGNSIYKMVKE